MQRHHRAPDVRRGLPQLPPRVPFGEAPDGYLWHFGSVMNNPTPHTNSPPSLAAHRRTTATASSTGSTTPPSGSSGPWSSRASHTTSSASPATRSSRASCRCARRYRPRPLSVFLRCAPSAPRHAAPPPLQNLNADKAELYWGPDPETLPVLTKDEVAARVEGAPPLSPPHTRTHMHTYARTGRGGEARGPGRFRPRRRVLRRAAPRRRWPHQGGAGPGHHGERWVCAGPL